MINGRWAVTAENGARCFPCCPNWVLEGLQPTDQRCRAVKRADNGRVLAYSAHVHQISAALVSRSLFPNALLYKSQHAD